MCCFLPYTGAAVALILLSETHFLSLMDYILYTLGSCTIFSIFLLHYLAARKAVQEGAVERKKTHESLYTGALPNINNPIG